MTELKLKTISFLASGRGSNFEAVAEEIQKGSIKAKAGILITDKSDALCLSKADKLGIDSLFIDPKKYSTKQEHEEEIIRHLENYGTDLVVACGYMRLLSPFFINRYKNRIINIHPSLLPAFPGKNGQKQAIDYGVKITGCTTHFIDEGTDTGPIIMQSAVPVFANDTVETLSSRILIEEHKILAQSVHLFCEDRLIVEGRKVIIK